MDVRRPAELYGRGVDRLSDGDVGQWPPGPQMTEHTGAGAQPDDARARVTLLTRPGCHLCDQARVVIARVCADLGESFAERSILEDPDLLERYLEEIPVTLVDGRQHDFWRVDETRLRAALAR